ncbi:alpha/beta fold hydrolase [Novosphingobium sp. BL-8A]|uniref:esterase/lipase family protein n=1 Tax=Novosphingobium sp. BL-8A TaxID=3127639 RepID=UPI003757B488
MERSSPIPAPLADARQAGILFLHGHSRTGLSMRALVRQFDRAGYRTCAPTYASLTTSVPDIAERLRSRLIRFRAEFDGPLHIVTHSLGGLVARALMKAARPDGLGRVVMLAPPHGGSEWADLLSRLRMNRMVLGPAGRHLVTRRSAADEAVLSGVDFELGIIAGNRSLDPVLTRRIVSLPNDGKVSVASTRLAGMADHITLPVSHTLMVNNREVGDQVAAFIRSGRFER